MRFVPVILPPAARRSLGLHYMGSWTLATNSPLTLFPTIISPLCSHMGQLTVFHSKRCSHALCLCTSYYSPSPLCENILPLTHPLTLELTLPETRNFYQICSFQDPAQIPFLCELVSILPGRVSHSCFVWCQKGHWASKRSPRNSHPLTWATCPNLYDSPPSFLPSHLAPGNYQFIPIHILNILRSTYLCLIAIIIDYQLSLGFQQ